MAFSNIQEISKIFSPYILSLRKLLEEELHLDEGINQQRGRQESRKEERPLRTRETGSLRIQLNSRCRKPPGQTAAGQKALGRKVFNTKFICDRLSDLLGHMKRGSDGKP